MLNGNAQVREYPPAGQGGRRTCKVLRSAAKVQRRRRVALQDEKGHVKASTSRLAQRVRPHWHRRSVGALTWSKSVTSRLGLFNQNCYARISVQTSVVHLR